MADFLRMPSDILCNKQVSDLIQKIDALDYRGSTKMSNRDLHLLAITIKRAKKNGRFFR